MAKKQWNAYEGDHLTLSGERTFTVHYRDRTECQTINRQLKRPHGRRSPYYPRCGWYYGYKYIQAGKMIGPFTSSQKAFKDAIENLK